MAALNQTLRTRAGTLSLWLGALLVMVWLLPTVGGSLLAHVQVTRFQAAHPETVAWAPGRVRAYQRALHVALPTPTAVLRIPSAAMEVPVLEGTSQLVMDRAAGHLPGTAEPGSRGNVVLASHRDGFFRRLKNIAVGDRIELQRPGGVDTYRVDALRIVERTDTAALQPTAQPVLTLVTCFPFFYIGPAPQRYVVRASLVSTSSQPTLHETHL